MTSSFRALLPIFLIVAVDLLGLMIVFPILPFYAEHYGASPTAVGWLVTAFALGQFLSSPILGRWSDRFGRKPVLILSQLGTCVGFIILALAHHLWVIFLSRIIDGLTAGNLPTAQAVISDLTPPEKRARAFGIIGISFGLGLFVGPAISGFLIRYGYSAPAWAAAALSLTSILCTIFLLPATKPQTAAIRSTSHDLFGLAALIRSLRQPTLGRRLAQFLFFSLSFSFFISGFPLFAERRLTFHGHAFDAQSVGYFYAYLGLYGILVQGGLIGPLVKAFGEARVVMMGFLTQAVGYAALAWVFRLPALLLTSSASSFGSGVLRPAITSLITQAAPRSEQGAILGVVQSLTSIAQIMAPLFSGWLIAHDALKGWAVTAGVLAAIGLALTR